MMYMWGTRVLSKRTLNYLLNPGAPAAGKSFNMALDALGPGTPSWEDEQLQFRNFRHFLAPQLQGSLLLASSIGNL